MNSFEQRLIAFFETIHPLDRIARAGYVVRGVAHPESVAAHSHFVSLLTLLFLEEFPGRFESEKALTMALIHDLSEAKLMDIPMPYADAYLKEAKDEAEQAVMEELFAGFSPKFAQYHREMIEASSPEARLVRGLDKVQLLLKVLFYERERSGYLEEFWNGADNFRDYGIAPVSAMFDAICAHAGRTRPIPKLKDNG
jgi:putative hydrolase of HD superfamily